MNRIDVRWLQTARVDEGPADCIRHQLDRSASDCEVVFALENLRLPDQHGCSWVKRHLSNSIEWNGVLDLSDWQS